MKHLDRHFAAALSLFLVAGLLATLPAAAKRSPGPTVLISPDEDVASARHGNREVDLATGAPTALYRVGYRVDPGTPEEMARQYLRENAKVLHLMSATLDDLRHHATRVGLASTTVRLRQYAGDVPVYNAEIAVSINRQNTVTYVASTYRQVGAVDTAAARTATEARQAALAFLGVEGGLITDSSELVVYANRGVTRLAHRLVLQPVVAPPGTWEVLRDAHTGEIFKAIDTACYGPTDGVGNVFDPDPLSSATAAYNDPGYPDNNDLDSPQLNAELMSRTLLDLDLTGGTYSLVGPYAVIIDNEAPFKGLFSQMSSTFSFNRFDDAFEAVNTYYHIDTYMRYMNETLGITVMPFQYAGGVQFDPHGLNGVDNSHYSGGRLAFGEGGVDDDEDADVIIHELGHGIHDWVTVGGLSQVNGLSEGTGDYFAQSYSRSFGQWTTADAAYHWVFSWDGHNPFWGGRTTNYGAIYPGGLTGQIHTDGQIWSTCNMRVWDAIGREQADKAMLEGLAMTGGGTNQQAAANAVLQAAIDMGYSGSELSAMATIFQSCGYQVELPGLIFADGFESGDTSAWSGP